MNTAPSISLLGSSALLFEAPGELDAGPAAASLAPGPASGESPEIQSRAGHEQPDADVPHAAP